MIEKICLICRKNFIIHKCRENKAKVCSRNCNGVLTGFIKRSKAKPRISTQGYCFIIKKEHYRANKQGYVKIADLILEEKIGRKLKKNEIAHHINHIKTDDSPNNLELMTKKKHDLLTINERWEKWRKLGKWSKIYNECIKCKTKNYKHMARGHCTYCYKKYIERKNDNTRTNEKTSSK